MSFGTILRITCPPSENTVGHGDFAEHGSGDVTFVMTSEESVPVNVPEAVEEPRAAASESMTSRTGALPCRTTSPQDTVATTSAVSPAGRAHLLIDIDLARPPDAFRLALDDSRRDEDQQLGARVVDAVAFEQPGQNGNLSEARRAIGGVLLVGLEDSANDRRLPVVDEQRRQSALRVDRGNGSWSGRTAEVGRGVLEHDLHDHGVGRCDLRGYFQGQ